MRRDAVSTRDLSPAFGVPDVATPFFEEGIFNMRSLLAGTLLLFFTSVCVGQVKTVTLDATFSTWDKATRRERAGVSIMQPQSLRFSARYLDAPKSCPNGLLKTILATGGRMDFLDKVPVGHCIRIAADSGRETDAYVEDVLVPGLMKDAKVGGSLDLHANLFGYQVKADRAKNTPVLLIFEFEPK